MRQNFTGGVLHGTHHEAQSETFPGGRPLLGGGVGFSLLDGIVRLDLSHAFRAPTGWRFDFYLDGLF